MLVTVAEAVAVAVAGQVDKQVLQVRLMPSQQKPSAFAVSELAVQLGVEEEPGWAWAAGGQTEHPRTWRVWMHRLQQMRTEWAVEEDEAVVVWEEVDVLQEAEEMH